MRECQSWLKSIKITDFSFTLFCSLYVLFDSFLSSVSIYDMKSNKDNYLTLKRCAQSKYKLSFLSEKGQIAQNEMFHSDATNAALRCADTARFQNPTLH